MPVSSTRLGSYVGHGTSGATNRAERRAEIACIRNVRSVIERVTARRAAQEAEAAETAKLAGKKRGPYKKRKAEPFTFRADLDADYCRYFNAEYLVATCPALSIAARGLYFWLAARMSAVNPAHEQIETIIGYDEITRECGISDGTARKLIAELRAVEAVYQTNRGANFYLRFTLPLKRARLRKRAEKDRATANIEA